MFQVFWADAVLTVCHLINRVSSSILDGKIPFSLFYPEKQLFDLPLKVFGCACFIKILKKKT